MTRALYDDVADWYETEFLAGPDLIGVNDQLGRLLGPGDGPCLEIGCGTGFRAPVVAGLGRTPIGVDLSAGMLRYTPGRLPAVRGDATRLPFASGSLPAAVAVMIHTDVPDYPAVLREAARVLRPGGIFVHIGVHPCFCGAFADRKDPSAVVISPGYLDAEWTKKSWTSQGVRDKVGATHLTLPALLGAFVAAGLMVEEFSEGGEPTPATFALRARKA